METLQLTEPFGEWADQQNGGTNIPINSCQNGQGGREREDTRRDTFREGPELLAAQEAERHEAAQLPEPFGE